MTSTANTADPSLFTPATAEDDASIAARQAALPAPMTLPQKLRAYWLLAVICLFGVIAQVDTGALPLLVNRIGIDLALSDLQMSMIMGLATTVVTSIFLIPAGYLADRLSRKFLLGVSAVIWSLTAAMSGLVSSFWSLFATRSGLAAAEATLQPTAHSLLRDAFPPHKRGSSFSIYWAAYALGGGISLLVCGTLLALADSGAFADVPIIGGWRTWQIVLALPGLCTLPLVLLIVSVREPKRSHDGAEHEAGASYAEFFGYIRQNWKLFWPSFLYNICWALQAYGVIAWQPTALQRGWGISATQIAQVTGAMGMATSLAGLLVGGWIIDQLGKRGIGDGAIKVCLVASGLGAIFQIAVYHASTPWLIFAFIGLHRLFQSTINSAYYVAVAYITPGRLMGRMIAVQFLCLNIPAAISPVMMAWIARTWYPHLGDQGIVVGIYVPLVFFSVLFMLFLSLLTYRIGQFRRLHPQGA